MYIGEVSLGGVPETAAFWILGLGGLAVLLAGLSLWTRKNSRHPLLLVGLAAFAIMFLGSRSRGIGIGECVINARAKSTSDLGPVPGDEVATNCNRRQR